MAIANITNNILTDSGIATSSLLSLTGGTLTGALSGTSATFSSTTTATAFIPSGSTIPTNGMYLSAANTLNFATNSLNRFTIASDGIATFGTDLYVNRNIYVNEAESGVYADFYGRNSTNTSTPLAFLYGSAGTVTWNNGGTKMTLTSAGALQLVSSLSATSATFSSSVFVGSTFRLTQASSVDIQAYTGAAYSNLNYDALSHNWQTGGGAAKMVLTNGGNFGVGTDNPSAVITAFSTNAATQFKAAGTAPAFTFSQSLTTSTYACVFGLATSANHFITGTAAGDMAIANQSATAGAIVFGTGTAEKMRMSSSGNFGIGTSTPVQPLQLGLVSVIAQDANSMYIGANFGNGTGGNYIRSQFANQIHFDSALGFINFKVAGSGTAGNAISYTTAMTITSGGNVGIGTSSPVDYTNYRSLHIMGASSTSSAILYLTNSTSSIRGLFFAEGSASRVTIGSQSNHDFTFVTNDTERMRIISGGQVQIKQGADTFSDGFRMINVAGNRWTFVNGGDNNLYYGFNEVNKGIFNNSTGTYTALSDINKKKDFESSTIGLNAILGLKPTLYRMKSDETEGDKELGFIAQEVKEFIPQAFVESGEDENKFIGLNYNAIVAALVKSVQEQQAQIEELKALINK